MEPKKKKIDKDMVEAWILFVLIIACVWLGGYGCGFRMAVDRYFGG